MSTNNIVNGAPLTIFRGIQDLSNRTLPVELEVLPTHLPKIYIYAQKGPTAPQLVVGGGRDQMYGSDSFDPRKKYANHQTEFANRINAQGNSQMIERIVPDDTGPKSNFLLSLDVLEAPVQQYQRAVDGSFILNSVTGLRVPVTGGGATISGYKAKWVLSNISTLANENTFGAAPQGVGTQTLNAVQSILYPILEFQASSYGEVFNNSGLRIWSPTEKSATGVNSTLLSDIKAYPFRLSAIRRTLPTSTPNIVFTEQAEPFFDFVLKANQVNSNTTAAVSLEDIFLNKYQNLEDLRFPLKFGDFGNIKVYQDNIDTLVNLFYNKEFPVAGLNSDFTGATDEKYLFNFIGGTSSKGAPYFTFELDTTGAGSVRLSENSNLYAKGGADGTMSNALFSAAVADRVAGYGDATSYLMNNVVYPESIIYDSGFPLATKYALCNFIAERKDTTVILSTYTVGGPEMTAAEESSLAVALRTRLQNFPESDFFGTSVVRGMIIGRYGNVRNSLFRGKLPLTLELADKAAKMMGSGDSRWKENQLFDRYPNNEITLFTNVNVTFTPAAVKNKDWDIGLNWVEAFSRQSLYFPALKTVYDNDTSVLNSFFTMMLCVELQKVGDRVRREFSGNISLTDDELIDRVNKRISALTVGRFAGLFRIVPAAYYTDADKARGYSYTLPIKFYANNLKTVSTLFLQAYRLSDFTPAT